MSCVVALVVALPTSAQEISQFGALGSGNVTIKKIRIGWDADQFAIETKEPIVNPAGCLLPDGYIAHATQKGYKEFYAAALSSMYSGRPIYVAISDLDCVANRPRIMDLAPDVVAPE